MTYRTYLINFGYANYQGTDLGEAKSAAVKAGFASVIYENDTPVLSYDPLAGWRGLC
jgi:hypothetical protein